MSPAAAAAPHVEVGDAREDELPSWLALAREVEPLFGPMADDPGFAAALREAVRAHAALSVRVEVGAGSTFGGGLVISPAENEVVWLAVAEAHRGLGLGRLLLVAALARLDPAREVRVQTFDGAVAAGQAARRLYQGCGFVDVRAAGKNPAGVDTVIMSRPPVCSPGGVPEKRR